MWCKPLPGRLAVSSTLQRVVDTPKIAAFQQAKRLSIETYQ
jgi:hypothetical protein